MWVTINVTRRRINRGSAGDAVDCPVAHAVNSVLRRQFIAVVHSDGIYIVPRGTSTRMIRLKLMPTIKHKVSYPRKVQIAISSYDISGKMEPFSFKLNIPIRFVKGLG